MELNDKLVSIKDYKNNLQIEIIKTAEEYWNLFKVKAGESEEELLPDEYSDFIAMKLEKGKFVESNGTKRWKLIFTGRNPQDEIGFYEGREFIVLQEKSGFYLSCDEDDPFSVYSESHISNSQRWKYQFVKVIKNGQEKIGLLFIAPNGNYLSYSYGGGFIAERTYPGEFEVFYSWQS